MNKLIYEYIEQGKRKGFKKKTLTDYRRKLDLFFNFLEENYPDVTEITEVSRDIVLGYEKYLAVKRDRNGRILTAERRVRYLSTLKDFFLYLVREERIYRNPATNIVFPREKKSIVKDVLTIEEMDKLLKSCSDISMKSIRDRAIMELLYSTGIRADELCSICVEDIDLEERLLFVRKGKLDKERLIPFGQSVVYWVGKYLEKVRPHIAQSNCRELFAAFIRGGKMSTSALYDLIKYWSHAAGIEKNVTTHTFRHTCALHMLKGRADIRYVQKQLGHKSIQTTEKYLKIEITDLKEIHDRCHPREQDDW